ncbi:hypothetical protein CYY_001477 [Polysphondylium violaceum]|uniref:Uncharacterized protein n=1 Tax=Polysphondylium violaceum TaxID=133409 RepID=A0A8J4PY60_9MYCE|nr:hypothetical protein CYY_001477 [Polysphondylium violaceum]
MFNLIKNKLNTSFSGATVNTKDSEVDNCDEFVVVEDDMTKSAWVQVDLNNNKENEQQRLLSMYQVKYEPNLQQDVSVVPPSPTEQRQAQQPIENDLSIVPPSNLEMKVCQVKQQEEQEEQDEKVVVVPVVVEQVVADEVVVPQIKEEEPEWLQGKTKTNYISRGISDYSYTSTVDATKPYTVASNNASYTSASSNVKPYFTTSNTYSYTSTSNDIKPYTSVSKSPSSYSYSF